MCLLSIVSFCLSAQEGMQDTIKEIRIQALRIEGLSKRSTVLVNQVDLQARRDISQQLSLQEYISTVPGVFSMNANNFAQDLRISIRGFGARAAFGIRGIKLVVDGIPETTPDGQGQLDNLNLNTINKIEIVKGPASSLYGNASGGVIHIQTDEVVEEPYLKSGLTFGSYGMQQYELGGGFKTQNTDILLNAQHIKTDGYREQSGLKSSSFGGKLIHHFSEGSKLKLLFNYTNSPQADDAGSLTADQAGQDRRQARDRNVLFQTGESISQTKIGLHHSTPIGKDMNIESYGFYSTRQFEGLLPFEFGGQIDLDRSYWGAGISLSQKAIARKAIFTTKLGIDLARQSDDRMRFRNLEGARGDLTLDQNEGFNNLALYYLGQTSVGKWEFSIGLRWDTNSLSTTDRFLNNGDDSGDVRLSGMTQSLGLSFSASNEISLFANIRESFETPSLSELSADPNGGTGFNDDVQAQEAINYEVGIRLFPSESLSADITVFHIDTENDLVPFELEAFPDRNFYQNAGSTNRTGVELSINALITNQLMASANYAYSDFEYDEYLVNGNNFSGNRLPAIPIHTGSFGLSYTHDKLSIIIQDRFIGSLYTNDSNSVEDESYHLLNLKCGYSFKTSNLDIKPFFGINNILNQAYNDNVRINAFGSRFFEPGPERNLYGGFRVIL